MGRHEHKPQRRGIWKILLDAGLVIIVVMGLALLGLALGAAFGLRLI